MLRKIALSVALVFGFTGFLLSPSAAPPAQAQFVIPCPTIPCPTFDGSNFVKNSLTEMHTLQQMYDTAVIKLQEIQRIKQMIADHQLSPDAAYASIQSEIDSMNHILDQNSQICQDIAASNQYFQDNLGLAVGNPCTAPTTAAAKAQIDNSLNVARHAMAAAKQRAAQTSKLARDANTNGIGVGQQTGMVAQLIAQVANEVQAEEVLQAANMKQEGAYYEQAVQHQNKEDANQSAAAKHWSYFFHTQVKPSPTPRP